MNIKIAVDEFYFSYESTYYDDKN